MLGLTMPTDPRWVNIVEKNIEEILTDHAWCEQKAASSAISVMVRFPEYPDLVDEMTSLAREEMEHFGLVHEKIKARGLRLGFERKDPYVKDLKAFIKKGGNRQAQLVECLLMSAMIEARSCERFRVLSEEIDDADLRKFYRGLMAVGVYSANSIWFFCVLQGNMAAASMWTSAGKSFLLLKAR